MKFVINEFNITINTLLIMLSPDYKKTSYFTYFTSCIGIVISGPVAQTVRQSDPMHIYTTFPCLKSP